MKKLCANFSFLLLLCLTIPSIPGEVAGQLSASLTARLLTPVANYEIALDDTLTPKAIVTNAGSVASSSAILHFRIRNLISGVVVYEDSIKIAPLAAGDSVVSTFSGYKTNRDTLSQIGTFIGCLWIGSDPPTCSELFAIRRTLPPFRDASNNYGRTAMARIPDQTRWVSLGAEVVDGDSLTWDPPPPRGRVGIDSLSSPVIRLDRRDASGNLYIGNHVGDTLTSFPINVLGQTHINLSFDFFRGGRFHYGLGWDSSLMLGPEPTVTDSAGNLIRAGDSLVLEFKNPGEPMTNPSSTGWDEIAGIDGGHDFEYKSLTAVGTTNSWKITLDGVTSALLNTPNYLDANFRFRLRLKAKSDALKLATPSDDADAWYIDNPTVLRPAIPVLELSWVRAVNPYTKVPRDQAIFPIFVRIVNCGASMTTSVPIVVTVIQPSGMVVLRKSVLLASVQGGADTVLYVADWDASPMHDYLTDAYTVTTAIGQTGFDDYAEDDSTYTKFYLNLDGRAIDQGFAFDDAGIAPRPGEANDIPKLSGKIGSGIGFNKSTGSIALKYDLKNKDTLYGVEVYFANGDQANEPIRISLLRDGNSCVPGDTISTFEDRRSGGFFNQFWPFYFPRPVVLDRGVYWISISQLTPNNMFMGADVSRGGAEFVSLNASAPTIRSMYATRSGISYGTQWGSGPADNNGDVGCQFAIETPAGSGNWTPLITETGIWPAMRSKVSSGGDGLAPRIPFVGAGFSFDSVASGGIGTYLPMIRPLVGGRLIFNGVFATAERRSRLNLETIQPNPFDPTAAQAVVGYRVTAPSRVTIQVVDVMAKVVKNLVDDSISAGPHAVVWNGRDESGARVPPGVYFLLITNGSERVVGKVVVR